MRKKNQIYLVEIKSQSILNEGKHSLVTFFSGGNRKTIMMNVRKLYPQYTKTEDKPMISITPIKDEEYQEMVKLQMIIQKAVLVNEVRE